MQSEAAELAPTEAQMVTEEGRDEDMATYAEQQKLLDGASSLPDTGVSVSGLAGRFPKSDDVNEFERNLRHGIDMINDEDESRFSCRLWNLPPRAGRLKDLSRFDAQFFGYSRDEANYIDYQMRILYEVVYESILDAGLNPADLRGSNTGVFFGFHCNEFENAMVDDPGFKSQGYYGQFATRIAQYFDLRGLTVTFDAACASGFVGLHHGVEAISRNLCERAIVCSANIPIHPTGSFIFLQMQMLSPTGYSRFMDSRADGYVKSESCVSVLLQRHDLSLRNYATFLATMTSVDGFKREGITFPSDKSQQTLIEATKKLAGLSTNHVEYFEAHGTGTPAGDPQEAKAIAQVYNPKPQQIGQGNGLSEKRLIGPLLLGSVKTNMGHSEAASGLCALTKVALMLEHETIYPSLHYEKPNENIESLKENRVAFVGDLRALRAKVVPLSCYGFGGSNVHAIVRANQLEAIADHATTFNDHLPRLLLMFGRGQHQLEHFFDKMLDKQDYQTKNCLSDDFLLLLDSLNSGKIDRLMTHRGFMIVDRKSGLQIARSISKCNLQTLERCQSTALNKALGRNYNHFQDSREKRLNLVFAGLGSNYAKMAAGLKQMPVFWSTIERLDSFLRADGFKLIDLLTQDRDQLSLCDKFCSIVAYQVALINLFISDRGLDLSDRVELIIGHSLGEIAAAYADNQLNEREAIRVAFNLGKTLDENGHLIAGRMIALEMDQSAARKVLEEKGNLSGDDLCISCINGPQSVTLSGSRQNMDQFCAHLSQIGHHFVEIENRFALHNPRLMNNLMFDKLRDSLRKILVTRKKHRESRSKWIRVATGDHDDDLAEYFARAMCQQVDFAKAIDKLPIDDDSISIELNASSLFESQFKLANRAYLKCMLKKSQPEQQASSLLKSIGQLYETGFSRFSLRNLYPKMVEISKCRRQTPSLSSLFKWQHEDEHFVPRYPLQFSKSSAKCEMPFDIMQDRDKYLLGHCIEGRCLFPATGYLFLIWRVFSFTQRKIYDASFQDVEQELVPIEFHQVRLSRAVILGNRLAQLYIHLEESTGRFEIKEGGSVVVDGWVKSPRDKPSGLLYESVRDQIQGEGLKCGQLLKEDIYKQFRVSGYDYGESFQNIVEASADGRFCRVKFNGHFVALTDSILQSIFLAVSQYAPSGGLFLPTRFDYVRFQPEVLKAKVRQANMKLDRCDGSLNTMAKREIMTKIMEREKGLVDLNQAQQADKEQNQEQDVKAKSSQSDEKDCFFDTYCDPVTGIIITDGIEMRGIKASPAPRKSDTKDVLLESYQFISDSEEPIEDQLLTGFKGGLQAKYKQCCNYLAQKICKLSSIQDQDEFELKMFKDQHLKCSFSKLVQPQNLAHKANQNQVDETELDSVEQENSTYDIKKNGNFVLLSLLDQLEYYADLGKLTKEKIGQVIGKNRARLMDDLLQSSFVCERLIRPVFECVLENCCLKKSKFSMLEINEDDGLLRTPIKSLINSIEPNAKLDYFLAHPEPARVANLAPTNEVKTHVLKDISSLLSDQRLRELDLILYKDTSCYANLPAKLELDSISQSAESIMKALGDGVKRTGFLLVLMRTQLTLSEHLLLSMADLGIEETLSGQELERRLEKINGNLGKRVEDLRRAAIGLNLIEVASKSDLNGCLVLLFRKPECDSTLKLINNQSLTQQAKPQSERELVLISHRDETTIDQWLSKLKQQFKLQTSEEQASETSQDKCALAEKSKQTEMNNEKNIWLCAVDTLEENVSGIIGMVQALRKELGAARLRCFYDQHTFARTSRHSVSLREIEQSKLFQLATKRDLVWNCVSQNGQLGSYRHLTIDSYLSYENCLCDVQKGAESKSVAIQDGSSTKACYINNAARGDLSSFTWYESPYKYLSESERQNLVQISYAALNFRDIMLATGRLPLDALPLKIAMLDCHIGLEFAGLELATGRRVMGMAPSRSLATQIACDPRSSIKIEIPDGMDMREAATIPVVYATVVLALVYRGKMRPGESILIHAGSGGVGQAAIRMALHFKLQVFTTVGTSEKRQFLLQEFGHLGLKDSNIFSSRDTEFERQIMAKTRGCGVDLVLNSLADDKLQASVRCLADGGRFLEIGKYDMSVDSHLELLSLDNNKTFHGILLDKLFDSDDANGPAFRNQLDCVLKTISLGLKEGFVKPIKYTLFKRHQIEEAFRFMATGKHIGKILIEINAQQEPITQLKLNYVPRFQLDPEAAHIVTGGLGGFGLELIKWLVVQGARKMFITSRSGLKTGYQRVTLKRLENVQGASFSIVTYDTTTCEGVTKLLKEASEDGRRRLGSIFHLAMVLKDCLVEKMSGSDFELVCLPKITTCQLMDSILEQNKMQLDHFVTFSSVTSGKGNAGQANYAYANSLLERVCERRRARGQHGLAIQWGAIGDVGAAYENLGGNNIIVGGTIPQRMPSCQATLAKLLCSPFATCLSVVPVNRNGPDGAGALGAKGDLVAAILHVLGIKDASKVTEEATLGELGLDSLMAVEIRQYIEREYDMTLNMQEIRSLTIGKIREIGEKGASKAKLSLNSEQQQQADKTSSKTNGGQKMLRVESYGAKVSQDGGKGEQTSAQQLLLQQLNNSANNKIQLDINFMGNFKPELSLPKRKFKKLNQIRNKRPLFFLPPIYGSFELLEPICKLITNRTCIGLNWTRSQARSSSMNEAVQAYLTNLRQWKWPDQEGEHIVDLVGYSYGATVAYEIMVNLQINNKKQEACHLKAGKLILLDGSPKQIEMGSQLMSALNRKAHLKLEEKVDELLMAYILSHTKHLIVSKRLDLIQFQAKLKAIESYEQKVKLASGLLCNLLELNTSQDSRHGSNNSSPELSISPPASCCSSINSSAASISSDQSDSGAASDSTNLESDQDSPNQIPIVANKSQVSQLKTTTKLTTLTNGSVHFRSDMELAMEAFIRRYNIIDKYKCSAERLNGNVTLIRAEQIYLKANSKTTNNSASCDEKINDLGLSSLVDKVELHVFPGNHETFLEQNLEKIASIINPEH